MTDHEMNYTIELLPPKKVSQLEGDGIGKVVIRVETSGDWTFLWPDRKYVLYYENMTMPEAKEHCVTNYGHLASVGSNEEQEELKRLIASKIGTPIKCQKLTAFLRKSLNSVGEHVELDELTVEGGEEKLFAVLDARYPEREAADRVGDAARRVR